MRIFPFTVVLSSGERDAVTSVDDRTFEAFNNEEMNKLMDAFASAISQIEKCQSNLIRFNK